MNERISPQAREKFQALGPLTLGRLLDGMRPEEQQGKFPIPGLGTPGNRILACEGQAWLQEQIGVTRLAETNMLKDAREAAELEHQHQRKGLRLSKAQTVISILALLVTIVGAGAALYPLFR